MSNVQARLIAKSHKAGMPLAADSLADYADSMRGSKKTIRRNKLVELVAQQKSQISGLKADLAAAEMDRNYYKAIARNDRRDPCVRDFVEQLKREHKEEVARVQEERKKLSERVQKLLCRRPRDLTQDMESLSRMYQDCRSRLIFAVQYIDWVESEWRKQNHKFKPFKEHVSEKFVNNPDPNGVTTRQISAPVAP